jgi:AAA domain-containing protein/bifunctional DNA primase/polymerase-like protein
MASSDVRLRLHAAGFDPTAVRGKEALMVGWNKKYTAEEVAAWASQYPTWTNTGIRTSNAPAFDIDIKYPEAAEASEELIRNLYADRGTLLTRIGEAPKRALLFRTTQPFPKIRVDLVAPNGSEHHIEVLGDGQQLVVDGTHPTTGKPYYWPGGYCPGNIPWSDLPEINGDEAHSLATLVTEMLIEKFGFQEAAQSTKENKARGPVDAEAELAAMAPTGKMVNHVQTRVIPSLLRRALSPQAVLETVVDATMAMAAKHGLDWTREREIKDVTSRINSGLKLVQEGYDATEGTIPDWLAPEFTDDWIKVLQDGGKPQLVRNRYGWHVRRTPHSGSSDTGEPPQHSAPEKAPEQKHYRFKLVPFAGMKPGLEQLYLVDELIPITGLVDIWGKAKCFKNFWTLDLMLHVAMGWEYRDRRVRQGTVIYCAFEGGHGYKKRCEAQRRYYKIADDADVPLYVMSGQASLVKDHKLLIADIRAQLGTTTPVAVVLDTLNRSIDGSESKDTDMGAYVSAAGAIRDAFGCVVIIVHHCGLDETRPRGHTSLPGAVDAQLAVTREGMSATVTVEMMRDGPEDTIVGSVLESIDVGEDEAGKVLTSLVVVPGEGLVHRDHRRWKRSLAVFHKALIDTLGSCGELIRELDDAYSPQVRAVALEHVRTEFYATYPAKGESEQQRQENRRRQFNRCVSQAQADDLIRIRVRAGDETMIWLAPGTT